MSETWEARARALLERALDEVNQADCDDPVTLQLVADIRAFLAEPSTDIPDVARDAVAAMTRLIAAVEARCATMIVYGDPPDVALDDARSVVERMEKRDE